MRPRSAAALAAVVVLLVASCGRDEPRARLAPISLTSRAPHDIEKVVWVRLSFHIAGDDTLEVRDRKTKLRIVEIYGDTVPPATYFFSASAGEPMPIDAGHLLFTADLAPGSYRGSPATYSLTGKGVPPIPGTTQAIGSASYVWFLKPRPQPLVRYDRLLEPCTLRLGRDGVAGSVHCPRLGSDVGDKTVSARWSWELL